MQEKKEKTYRIIEQQRKLSITIPRALAQSIGLQKGDKIKWMIDRGELILKKV